MAKGQKDFRSTSTCKQLLAVLRSLDSSAARDVISAVKRQDWDYVSSSTVDPSAYETADAFARDYLATSLLRKLDCLPLEVDKKAVAIRAFHDAEENCRAVNHYRGRNPFVPDIYPLDRTLEATMWLAKAKIAKLLGTFDWNSADRSFGFSSGASTRLKRKAGAPFFKYQGKPEVTRNCALLAICAIWSRPLWAGSMRDQFGDDPCEWVTIVDGSRTTTVPKNAKTDRTICIEPDMNMFIQRGIGMLIRRALRKVSIDLNDQRTNQRLARIGSQTGSLATIDLSSASDSVSLSLVEALLPADWFDAICRTRSELCTMPDGTKHHLEKVSSMGNGFTFELESLIFWAIASAVVDLEGVEDTRIGIYGDDIVVHHSVADKLLEMLNYCGFTPNVEKTFVSGPFRESCGHHYFYGVDVTPFYAKAAVESPNRKFWLINSFRIWLSREGRYWNAANRYGPTLTYLYSLLDKRHRNLRVPGYEGLEAGLIADFDEVVPRYNVSRQAFSYRVLRSARKRWRPNGVGAALQWFQSSAVVDPLYGDSMHQMLESGEAVYRSVKAWTAWWDNSNIVPLAEFV